MDGDKTEEVPKFQKHSVKYRLCNCSPSRLPLATKSTHRLTRQRPLNQAPGGISLRHKLSLVLEDRAMTVPISCFLA